MARVFSRKPLLTLFERPKTIKRWLEEFEEQILINSLSHWKSKVSRIVMTTKYCCFWSTMRYRHWKLIQRSNTLTIFSMKLKFNRTTLKPSRFQEIPAWSHDLERNSGRPSPLSKHGCIASSIFRGTKCSFFSTFLTHHRATVPTCREASRGFFHSTL